SRTAEDEARGQAIAATAAATPAPPAAQSRSRRLGFAVALIRSPLCCAAGQTGGTLLSYPASRRRSSRDEPGEHRAIGSAGLGTAQAGTRVAPCIGWHVGFGIPSRRVHHAVREVQRGRLQPET